MKNMFEKMGKIDSKGEHLAQSAQRETLSEIEEDIGSERYRELIGKLANNEPLSEEDKKIITSIREKQGQTQH